MIEKMRLGLAARVIAAVTAIGLAIMTFTPGFGSQASCIMPTTGTVSGLTLVNSINACTDSILSVYSGGSPPSSPTTGMLWYNTSSKYVQQYDGAAWNNIWYVDNANHLTTATIGGGAVNATIASASTTDIGSIPQSFITVTGTTPIASFGSNATIGSVKIVKFSGSLTLTYSAVSMILPSNGLSITTQAGDVAFALYLGSGNWQVLNYVAASGAAITNPAVPLGSLIFGTFMTLPPKTVYGVGQALSRSSFPAYFAAVSRAQTMTRTAGNAVLTSVADTSGMGPGMPVEGVGISSGCTISSVTSSTITLNNSTCVTANGTATITVIATGYGSGGDSTTVGVVDCRGRVAAGRDGMVFSNAGRLTTAGFGAGGDVLNASGSSFETATIGTGNLPPYTPAGFLSFNDPGHQHSYQTNSSTTAGPGGGGTLMQGPVSVSTSVAVTGVSAVFIGQPQGGTSTPLRVVQPTIVTNCVQQVTP